MAADGPARPLEQPMVPPFLRWLGLVWVAVSLPFITAVSAFFDSPDAYVFIMVFMASGAYTTPALVAALFAVRHASRSEVLSHGLLFGGLILTYTIGLFMLAGLVVRVSWIDPLGLPTVGVAGVVHLAGLIALVRRRSGRRALSVDLIEATGSTIAVAAPLVVLWGPTVLDADAAWFTLPSALAVLWTIHGTYWASLLMVRLGPGRGLFEISAVGLASVGLVNASLQTAQGVSGFTLPFPPLIALNALCMSMYLLIPLHTPWLLRQGLNRLPPQAQVRGSRMATVVSLAGLAALLLATAQVHAERPWAVPFALGVVSVLFVLAGLRQMAAVEETRRLYRQVEQASDERRRLLTQLLERSVHDRRRFAGQLYEQAVAAYTSFTMLAGEGRVSAGTESPAVARASALVGGDLARQADSVRELVLAIRPLEGDRPGRQRLSTPIAAYLASVYGDQPAPRLTVEISEDLALDWITETVLLQIVQEAVHNVWRHSKATSIDVTISVVGKAAEVRVADDGGGFDPAAVTEGPGIAAMQASAAVVGGTLAILSHPGMGTTVLARLGADIPAPAAPAPAPAPAPPPPGTPVLRVVPD